jgi:hypothetical protein
LNTEELINTLVLAIDINLSQQLMYIVINLSVFYWVQNKDGAAGNAEK